MTMPKKHTLLVVDDEPDVCDSVQDLLRREFTILKAKSAAEGLKILEEKEVHIIMTDQRMPQITGVEFLKKMRLKFPHAVRLLFTGYSDLDSIIAAINQGQVFRFIKKPWQVEELEIAVHEAAREYERIVSQAEEIHQLRLDLQQLRDKIHVLEEEMHKLKQK